MDIAKQGVPKTEIRLTDVGRRFNRTWVFRNITHTFLPNVHTAILGPNGSGKSTLLQTVLGILSPSEGKVAYVADGRELDADDQTGLFSMAAPYLELPEEFTLREMLEFQSALRPFRNGLDTVNIMKLMELEHVADRALRHYSSGMRQRVKLGLTLLSDTPFVLLDEPTSNLDAAAVKWYQQLTTAHMTDRTFIVCSNMQEQEYSFCDDRLLVSDFG